MELNRDYNLPGNPERDYNLQEKPKPIHISRVRVRQIASKLGLTGKIDYTNPAIQTLLNKKRIKDLTRDARETYRDIN
jgi:hypothetical protein